MKKVKENPKSWKVGVIYDDLGKIEQFYSYAPDWKNTKRDTIENFVFEARLKPIDQITLGRGSFHARFLDVDDNIKLTFNKKGLFELIGAMTDGLIYTDGIGILGLERFDIQL